MKITIFGLTLSSSWGNGHATPWRAILRALHRMGHQLTFFEKDVRYYYKHRDFSQCDFCRLVLYSDWHAIRPQALREAAVSDVVISTSYLPEGACINDELLSLPAPLHVYYDLDSPITLRRLRQNDQGLDYIRADQLSAFDLCLSFVGGRALAQFEHDWRARRTAPLYGCVDPDIHFRKEVPSEFRCLLSYMGTYAADRQCKLEALFLEPARRLTEKRFVLAGAMYPPEMVRPRNLQWFPHVGPADHAALYSSSSATLNITRAEMADYGFCPSGRFFEAAACGTPVISDIWEGIDQFFAPGNELLLVRNTSDVLALLQISPEGLEKIGARARERTLDEHTGAVRAHQLVRALEQARSAAHAATEAA